MTIFLETNDENIIETLEYPDIRLDIPVSRLQHLENAAEGLLLFSDISDESPMYVGPVKTATPKKISDTEKYVNHKKNDLKILSKYLGSLLIYPRDIFVLANTKNWLEQAEELVECLPETWWTTTGFISVNNADRLLEAYEDVFPYSTFIAVDNPSKVKLEYNNIDYVDATHLGRSERDGLWFRELARRPEKWGVVEDPNFTSKGD